MKVLLAEDDDAVRETLQAELERLGYRVLAARDGAEAWDLYLREPVFAVISDWRMPRLDGPALCRNIRETPRDGYVYFILLTGVMLSRDSRLEAMDDGVDDFLVKPVDLETLWLRLRVAERIRRITLRNAHARRPAP